MEFETSSKCKVCGCEFITNKRYNDFTDEWEPDSDSCNACSVMAMKRILAINADW